MEKGDFMHNEKSITIQKADTVSIVFSDDNGNETVLKNSIPLLEREVIDAAVLNKKELLIFLESQINDAKEKDILFSLHKVPFFHRCYMSFGITAPFAHGMRIIFCVIFNCFWSSTITVSLS